MNSVQVPAETPEHSQCLSGDGDTFLGSLHLVARALVRFLHKRFELGQINRERRMQYLSDSLEQIDLNPRPVVQEAPPQKGISSSA